MEYAASPSSHGKFGSDPYRNAVPIGIEVHYYVTVGFVLYIGHGRESLAVKSSMMIRGVQKYEEAPAIDLPPPLRTMEPPISFNQPKR
jgi:hypothetical protein